MLTEQRRQRLRALQQVEMDGALSSAERMELDAFVQQIEAEEEAVLAAANERMRQERRQIEEQNAALAALIRRKERLAQRLERILALSTAERVHEDLGGWPEKSTGVLDETDLSRHTLDPSVRLRGAIADGRNGIAVHGAGN